MATTVTTDEKRAELCSDVLVIALDGGIGYWAVVQNVIRSGEFSVSSMQVRDSEDTDAAWFIVNRPEIERALRRTASDSTIRIRRDIRAAAAVALAENDASEVDCEVADVVVQVAVFGDIIFG